MGNKTDVDGKFVTAIGDIRACKDNIAAFLRKMASAPDTIIRDCDECSWNESVAYDLREALFKLGCVLADLMAWESECGLTRDQLKTIDDKLAGKV